MTGKFEEMMRDVARPKYTQTALNIVIFSGIVFFVLFAIAVGLELI